MTKYLLSEVGVLISAGRRKKASPNLTIKHSKRKMSHQHFSSASISTHSKREEEILTWNFQRIRIVINESWWWKHNTKTVYLTWAWFSTGVTESDTYKTLPVLHTTTNKKPSAAWIVGGKEIFDYTRKRWRATLQVAKQVQKWQNPNKLYNLYITSDAFKVFWGYQKWLALLVTQWGTMVNNKHPIPPLKSHF